MCSRGLGADYVIGLTDAEVAVLPPETAAEFIYRRQLESLSAEERERALHGYVDEIRRRSSGPALLSVGVVDKIIEPEELRTTLIDVVKSLHHRYVRTRLDSAQMP
jgi:propionyl-CoA carboxylase beta chain